METTTKEVLDVKEAASLLNVTERTIRELARKGEIPGRKVGKEWRFTRTGILRWIDGEDFETLSAKDWEAVRRGLDDIKAGRFVTLEQYDQGKRP